MSSSTSSQNGIAHAAAVPSLRSSSTSLASMIQPESPELIRSPAAIDVTMSAQQRSRARSRSRSRLEQIAYIFVQN